MYDLAFFDPAVKKDGKKHLTIITRQTKMFGTNIIPRRTN